MIAKEYLPSKKEEFIDNIDTLTETKIITMKKKQRNKKNNKEHKYSKDYKINYGKWDI